MPGAAHDHDRLEPVAPSRADGSAHVGLALQFGPGCDVADACCVHRFGDGVEGRGAVAAVFDHVLPPAFGVVVAGCCGEIPERVGRRRLLEHRLLRQMRRWGLTPASHSTGQRDREGQVDGAYGHLTSVRPRDRLPLRAEGRQRRECGAGRFGDDVAEQRHRRHEVDVADPAQRRLHVGGEFDEHDVGDEIVECAEDRSRGSGAVVPDAEQVQGHGRPFTRPGRGRRRRSRPIRHVHAPPLRGTHARPPCRGSGR